MNGKKVEKKRIGWRNWWHTQGGRHNVQRRWEGKGGLALPNFGPTLDMVSETPATGAADLIASRIGLFPQEVSRPRYYLLLAEEYRCLAFSPCFLFCLYLFFVHWVYKQQLLPELAKSRIQARAQLGTKTCENKERARERAYVDPRCWTPQP